VTRVNTELSGMEDTQGRYTKTSHDALTRYMKSVTSKMGSTWITGFGPSES
jgi:hypothetical protein